MLTSVKGKWSPPIYKNLFLVLKSTEFSCCTSLPPIKDFRLKQVGFRLDPYRYLRAVNVTLQEELLRAYTS